MNDIAPTWHDALVMLSGFACLVALFAILLFARRKLNGRHRTEADRQTATAEMRLFTDS